MSSLLGDKGPEGMWTKRRGIQPGDMSKYRGSATMVDEPTLQKPEGPPLDARVETRMIESDTLEKAHQFTKWLQPARPPADASLNSHISDVGLDGCATGLCSCWFVMRSVGIEVQVTSATRLPKKEVGRHFHIVWRLADGRMRGSVPAMVRPMRDEVLAPKNKSTLTVEERAHLAQVELQDRGDLDAALYASRGKETKRGREALTRLTCEWNYHFVFVRKFLTNRSTGRITDHHPLIFDIVESGEAPMGPSGLQDPLNMKGQIGRVLGSVTVNLREHMKMINPWEALEQPPYEIALRGAPPGGGRGGSPSEREGQGSHSHQPAAPNVQGSGGVGTHGAHEAD